MNISELIVIVGRKLNLNRLESNSGKADILTNSTTMFVRWTFNFLTRQSSVFLSLRLRADWIPACAGMTGKVTLFP
jgi:hypothetical protein